MSGPLEVTLTLDSIYDEVNARTYYQGESLKRKDIDYVSVQTSGDDYDALRTYVETALNNVCGYLLKKVKGFTWGIADDDEKIGIISISLVPYCRVPAEHAEKVCKLVGKALFDYIVNYTLYEWYLVVKTELAGDVGMRNDALLSEVLKHIGMASGRIRRRATDLAGI